MKENMYPKGLKWTKQRKEVYAVLKEAKEPLNAVKIYQLLLQKDAEINYAVSTIYRILQVFEEQGLVEKNVFIGDGTVVYELKHDSHTHYAICLMCHKKVALPECPFEHAHLHEATNGFTVTGHKLELYGYCKNCEHAENA